MTVNVTVNTTTVQVGASYPSTVQVGGTYPSIIYTNGSGGGATQNDAHYRHVQIAPSATWTVTHGLGKCPSVAIVDTAGNMVIANVKYISIAVVECSFSAPFSGEAYCN